MALGQISLGLTACQDITANTVICQKLQACLIYFWSFFNSLIFRHVKFLHGETKTKAFSLKGQQTVDYNSATRSSYYPPKKRGCDFVTFVVFWNVFFVVVHNFFSIFVAFVPCFCILSASACFLFPYLFFHLVVPINHLGKKRLFMIVYGKTWFLDVFGFPIFFTKKQPEDNHGFCHFLSFFVRVAAYQSRAVSVHPRGVHAPREWSRPERAVERNSRRSFGNGRLMAMAYKDFQYIYIYIRV